MTLLPLQILETKAVDTKSEKKDTKKDTKVNKENASAVNEKTPEVKAEKIITEPKQDKEKAKDWGRASNDPRNKS